MATVNIAGKQVSVSPVLKFSTLPVSTRLQIKAAAARSQFTPEGKAAIARRGGSSGATGFKSVFGGTSVSTSNINQAFRGGLPSTQIRDPNTGFVFSKGTRHYSEIFKKMQAELAARAVAAREKVIAKAEARARGDLDIQAPPIKMIQPTSAFDVRGTQGFEISAAGAERERQKQLMIGATVAGAALFPGVSLAAGVPLGVIGGQLVGGALVGEGARQAAGRVVSGFEPGTVTEFGETRASPNIDVRSTVGNLERQFAGTTTTGIGRIETTRELDAKKDFVVTVASILGFSAGVVAGGSAIQGLQGFLSRSNPKVLLTTNSTLTKGKQFVSAGKEKVIILVEKGSAVEMPSGKIVTVTNRGVVITPKTQGRFINAGTSQGIPTGTTTPTTTGTGFALTPTPTPSLAPISTPTVGLAALSFGLAPAVSKAVSKTKPFFDFGKVKPLDFSGITGTSKRPLTAAEAIASTKDIRRVSPKPGFFDISGKPIPKTTTFKKPATALEALEFAKGVRKVSPKAGAFDILGRPIEKDFLSFKRPATTLEALEFAKGVRKVSPKAGVFTITERQVSDKFGIPKRPLTAKEAIEQTKDIRRIKLKKRTFRPPRTFEEVFKIEKPFRKPVSRKPSRAFGLDTVTVQKVKPLDIPGSFISLSRALPRVSKTPTQALFEREMFGISGTKPKPLRARGLFDTPSKTVFQAPRATAFEKQLRAEVGREVSGSRRFADALGFSIFQIGKGRTRQPIKGAERVSPIDAFNTTPKQKKGIIDLTKAFDTPIIRRGTGISEIFRETPRDITRPKASVGLLPRITPGQRPREAIRVSELFIEKEKQKIKQKQKTRIVPLPAITKKKRKGSVSGYHVLVRGSGKKTSQGKWLPGAFKKAVTGVLSRKQALALGQSRVANTAKRTFRLVKATGTPAKKVGKLAKFNPAMFRKSKGKYTEKNAWAINTPGERAAITSRGLATLRKRPVRKRSKPKRKTKKKTRQRAFARFGI